MTRWEDEFLRVSSLTRYAISEGLVVRPVVLGTAGTSFQERAIITYTLIPNPGQNWDTCYYGIHEVHR